MRDFLLFGLAPYLAAVLLVCVPVWRLRSPLRRAALADEGRFQGFALWPWSLGLVLLGHAVAFLLPRSLMLWNRVPARLLVLEGVAFVLGLAVLGGLVRLLAGGWGKNRIADLLLLTFAVLAAGSGLLSAAFYRWGSEWYAMSLLPWFRSLLALRPDTGQIVPLPPLVKLHVLSGIAAAAALPFSRALLIAARPVLYVARLIRAFLSSAPGRVAAAGVELALVGLLAAFLVGGLRRVGLSQGYVPPQPVAFSHRLHAGKYSVPCLYCHFAAGKSRHAGIPPAGVCMGCHGQLKVASAELGKLKEAVRQARPVRWVKVHNLPDFVYFNHSQHVTAGVACQQCHGPVETMDRVRQVAPLTMGWCLDCHRREGSSLDCGKCHY
jgi:nitrate reductase gamma subunit